MLLQFYILRVLSESVLMIKHLGIIITWLTSTLLMPIMELTMRTWLWLGEGKGSRSLNSSELPEIIQIRLAL